MIAINTLPIATAGMWSSQRLRHRKFGVCVAAGRRLIDGMEFVTLAFANGLIHFPKAREDALHEALDVPDIEVDEDGRPRLPPLSRLGVHVEAGYRSDIDKDNSLPPRLDVPTWEDVAAATREVSA